MLAAHAKLSSLSARMSDGNNVTGNIKDSVTVYEKNLEGDKIKTEEE